LACAIISDRFEFNPLCCFACDDLLDAVDHVALVGMWSISSTMCNSFGMSFHAWFLFDFSCRLLFRSMYLGQTWYVVVIVNVAYFAWPFITIPAA